MIIAFFGLSSSFDYRQIGGSESIVRRLAEGMIESGDKVDYILFNADSDFVEEPLPGLRLRYFKYSGEAVKAVLQGYDYVVSLYLPAKVRLRYIFTRLFYKGRIKFYTIILSVSESLFKRALRWVDSGLGFNKIFVISERLKKQAESWGIKPVLMLPPVPVSYFVDSKPKEDKKLRIIYVGRTQRGKGIEDVMGLFSLLKDDGRFDLAVYGYHWPGDEYSLKMHNFLKSQDRIEYIYVPYRGYSSIVEEQLKDALLKADVLVLPYRDPQGTIDMPMLLLEGMASLCVVVTRSFRDIPDVYGESLFIVDKKESLDNVARYICDADRIVKEQNRIAGLKVRESFKADNVVKLFRSVLING